MNPRARHLGWTAAGLFTAGVLADGPRRVLHIGEAQANPEALAASSAQRHSIGAGSRAKYTTSLRTMQAAV